MVSHPTAFKAVLTPGEFIFQSFLLSHQYGVLSAPRQETRI
jgi:hypothetical protein